MIDENGHLMIAAWLATYLVHSTILLGLAWFVAGRLLRSRDDLAEMIWKLAIVTPLLSATIQVAFGLEPVIGRFVIEHRYDAESSASADDAPTLTLDDLPASPVSSALINGGPARPARSLPLIETERIIDIDEGRTDTSSAPSVEAPAPNLASEREPSGSIAGAWAASVARVLEFFTHRWRGAVFALIAVLAMCPILRETLAWLRLHRRLAHRRRLEDGPLVDMLDDLRRRAGIRARIRLTTCRDVEAPMAFGFVRPEICVPPDVIDRLGRAQLRSMLAHELAHLRRHDPAWLWVIRFVESALPFQPLNRVAGRRLRGLSELNCDAWAAAQTGDRLTLAHCLTEVAGWMIGRRTAPQPIGMAGQASTLRRRIERLLDERCESRRVVDTRWMLVIAPILTTAAVMAAPRIGAPRLASEIAPTPGPPAVSREPKSSAAPINEQLHEIESLPLDDLMHSLRGDLDLLDQRVGELREASWQSTAPAELREVIAELTDRTLGLRGRADHLETLWNEHVDASAESAAEHARRAEPIEPNGPTERSGDS
jgi:beta-lactamase regulating signal transducer with metallopeptidase domain